MSIKLLFGCLLLLLAGIYSINLSAQTTMNNENSFINKKQSFKTNLMTKTPAPGEWEELVTPNNGMKVRYSSNNQLLNAYVLFPKNDRVTKRPIVVYFHGGTTLSQWEFERPCEMFLNAGYIVMLPTFRGENGNPGYYELFYGEVDDAVEAIKWIAKQNYTDTSNIYTYGHSMGGEISAILSLYDGLSIKLGGSCGAFFPRPDKFGAKSMFNCPLPFNQNDEIEVNLRSLYGHFNEMNIKHYAYIGTEDEQFGDKPYRNFEIRNTLLEIIEVEGTHGYSLKPATQAFIEIIKNP